MLNSPLSHTQIPLPLLSLSFSRLSSFLGVLFIACIRFFLLSEVYAFSFRLFDLHHMHSTRTPRARAPHMHFFLAFKIGLLHHCVVALLDFGKHRLLFHRPHPSFPLRTVFIVVGGFPLRKDAAMKAELWKRGFVLAQL